MMTVYLKDVTKIGSDHKLSPAAMSAQLKPVTGTYSKNHMIIPLTGPILNFHNCYNWPKVSRNFLHGKLSIKKTI